jgi:hypothetical protein
MTCHIPEKPHVTFIFVMKFSSTDNLNTAHKLRQQTYCFIFKKVQAKSSVKVKVRQSRYRPGVAQRVPRKLRFPDFVTSQDGGKVVSLTHRPPLPPGNTAGTHFC